MAFKCCFLVIIPQQPLIEFEDACGNGNGATGIVIIDPGGDDDPEPPDGGDDDFIDDDGDGLDDRLGVGRVRFDLEKSATDVTAPIKITFQLLGEASQRYW